MKLVANPLGMIILKWQLLSCFLSFSVPHCGLALLKMFIYRIS